MTEHDTNEFYDDKETMPLADRECYYNEVLRWFIRYAYENSPANKEKLDRAGIHPSEVNSFKDLERIPITRVDELTRLQKENPPFGGFLAVPPDRITKIAINPGNQYIPVAAEEGIASAKVIHAGGARRGDIGLCVGSYTYHMANIVDVVFGYLGVTIVPTGPGNTDFQIQVLRDVGATLFTPIFTRFLVTIIERAEEMGYNIKRDFRLRLAYIGGEMMMPSLRKRLEESYGLECREIYGSALAGIIACECSYKSGMHVLDEAIIEVVEPRTGKQLGPGEIGELVITTAHNKVYPMVRWGSEDLCTYTDKPCPCGRTSLRLGRILGRVGDSVRVRGAWIHPHQVEEIFASIPEVSKYQVLLANPRLRDEITFHVELKEELGNVEALRSKLQQAIEASLKLRVDRIEVVPGGTIPEGAKMILDQRRWD